MRAIKPNNRRRSPFGSALLIIGALTLGGIVTVAALGVFNVIDLGKLAYWKKPLPIPKNWVAIPVCTKSIPAYTSVTRDYLLDRSGQWFMDHQPPEKVPKGVITDISKIRGRVTARAMEAPSYFKEEDFLPKGSSPGIAGGTPAGKRAYTLDVANLKGVVHDLREGDHVDLRGSVSVDMPGMGHSNAGHTGTNVVATPDMTFLSKRSFVRPLVQDGVVVMPVRTRNVPIVSRSLTQGTSTRTIPKQEIVIAVEPQEVALLDEAVDLKYEITCVARSGRPDPLPLPISKPTADKGSGNDYSRLLSILANAISGGNGRTGSNNKTPTKNKTTVDRNKSATPPENHVAMDITPGLNPFAGIQCLEVMIGRDRQFMLFTGPGNSPVVAFQNSDDPTKVKSSAEESKQ